MSASSNAYERFMESTKGSYERWHEGIPYDLDALRQMTAAEQANVVRQLRSQPRQDWRDVEAFQIVATTEALEALHDCLGASSAEARLHAADKLHELGRMPTISDFVANELRRVVIVDGMVWALRLAVRFPTDQIKRTLLEEARRRPEVGVHYAATLCFITGVTKTDFDWSMRPFFLRFGEHNRPEDRARSSELSRMTGMANL